MQVILMHDVIGLGDIGDVVNVRPGYARNFLIPRGFAVESGTASARAAEHVRRQVEAKKRRAKIAAEAQAERIRELTLGFSLSVSGGGRVYGSIGTRDVAAKLLEYGFEIDRRRVVLPEPIKKLGDHKVSIRLHPEVHAEVNVSVTENRASEDQESDDAQKAKDSIEKKMSARKSRKKKAEKPASE